MDNTIEAGTINPRAALDTAIDAAFLAEPIIETQGNRQHVMVPDGYRLENVTDPHALPPRIAQAIVLDDRESLTGYINRFSDERSILIADYDRGSITGHLDWHQGNQADNSLAAQPNKHRAALILRDSEEFKRWNEMEGDMHSQEKFAEFIEENVSDVIDPDHSDLLEICRELEATTDVAFRSGIRLENGDRTFTYETETKTKGEISVPTEIKLSIPLYLGESPVEVLAKFRFKPRADGLYLGFRWHRVEYQRQATFTQMATTVSEETGRPVIFGRAGA